MKKRLSSSLTSEGWWVGLPSSESKVDFKAGRLGNCHFVIGHSCMNFTDASKNSVQSLLALLRSTQNDGSGGGGSVGGAGSPDAREGASSAAGSAGHAPASSATTTTTGRASPVRPGAAAQPGRNAQLSALLAQLGDAGESGTTAAPGLAAARTSAFDGPTHGLIDPFGPVGQTPRAHPRRSSGDGTPSGEGPRAETAQTPPRDKGKRKADAVDDRDEWSFTRCLPVLTDLLRDDAFVKELRKMKADQDALERRLWARMEKLKADLDGKTSREREIAKVTRKPVPPATQAKWDTERRRALDDFFRRQVLPATDGLAARQRARLVELGVPGLGRPDARGEDAAARKVRVQRIMGVLEGAMEG